MIVVNIEKTEVPAMYFERDFLSFVNEIGAEIGFDVFNYKTGSSIKGASLRTRGG
jgi:hypothetical protein